MYDDDDDSRNRLATMAYSSSSYSIVGSISDSVDRVIDRSAIGYLIISSRAEHSM
jgi:hypothetical protein